MFTASMLIQQQSTMIVGYNTEWRSVCFCVGGIFDHFQKIFMDLFRADLSMQYYSQTYRPFCLVKVFSDFSEGTIKVSLKKCDFFNYEYIRLKYI